MMLVKEAKAFGNISIGNTKMPGTTFAIDAFACVVGSKLALIPDTPCYKCYARKLQKLRPSVDQGWKSNLSKWQQTKPEDWEQAMTFQILRYNTDGFHRWFDSGDLQSVGMLQSIVNICLMTPNIKHWIPTQERSVVKKFKKLGGIIPDNLIIRISASKLNGAMPNGFNNGSQVFTKGNLPKGKECKAITRGNNCGPCRACWDKSVEFISYPKH
jgi:hypothetical protein